MLPDEKSHDLGTQRESGGGECRISDDFGLRSPVIQKVILPKKRYTSIVAYDYPARYKRSTRYTKACWLRGFILEYFTMLSSKTRTLSADAVPVGLSR